LKQLIETGMRHIVKYGFEIETGAADYS
jgi:hypothetical protein